MNGKPIRLTLTVEVGGETKEFAAEAATTADPYRVAESGIDGITGSAKAWIRDRMWASEREKKNAEPNWMTAPVSSADPYYTHPNNR